MSSSLVPSQVEKLFKKPFEDPAVAIGVSIAALSIGIYYSHYHANCNRLNLPGPGGSQFLAFHRHQQNRTFHQWLMEGHDKYGDTYVLYVLGKPMIVTTNPDINSVTARGHEAFGSRTKKFLDAFSDWGNPLFALSGERWAIHRPLLTRTFTQKHLRYSVRMTAQKCKAALAAWEGDRPVQDLSKFFPRLTLDVIGLTVVSYDLKCTEGERSDLFEAFEVILTTVLHRSRHSHLMWWYTDPYPRDVYTKARAMMFNAFQEAVVAKQRNLDDHPGRGEGEATHDIIDVLLENQASAPEDQRLSEKEMVSEVVGLLMAGMGTTADSLAHCLFHLASRPEIEQKVYSEIREVFGDEEPTLQSLSKTDYLKRFIKEVLRFEPVFWLKGYQPPQDIEVSGLRIPAGSTIFIHLRKLFRDPRYFPNPEAFDPDRWLDADSWLVPNTYTPFGGGPRRCIGDRLANVEIESVLIMLLQRLRPVRIVNEPRLHYGISVNFRETGLHVEFERR